MIAARRAAVAAAGVEVAEEFAGLPNRGGLILLLDVHMERIEMQHERILRKTQLRVFMMGGIFVGLQGWLVWMTNRTRKMYADGKVIQDERPF